MALGKGLGSLIPTKSRFTIHKETGGNIGAADSDRVWHIPISEISPNAEQPRKTFSHAELEELVASIQEHGILQPILVTEKSDSGYELVAGERRLRAAAVAGLATVPALVKSATQQEKLELALIENIQRQDLNPIEEAFAYRRLMDEFHLTQDEVAKKVGRSRPAVANMVRLLDLPSPIQKALMDGEISMGKARAILSLKDEREQLQMFAEMTGNRASVRDVERAVAGKGQASRKGSVRRDPNLAAQEAILEERLGAKVTITKRGERGKIAIEFYSNEELRRLMGELT